MFRTILMVTDVLVVKVEGPIKFKSSYVFKRSMQHAFALVSY
jgi:hypothetical protein